MSETITRLLNVLQTQRGRELRFEISQPARLVDAAGGVRDLSSRSLSKQEILTLLGPRVPDHAREGLSRDARLEFQIESDGLGAFSVTVAQNGDHFIVSIFPGNGARAASSSRADTAVTALRSGEPQPAQSPTPAVDRVTSGAQPIDRLFRAMCETGASDLHLCVGLPPMVRKDGQMQPLDPGESTLDPAEISRLLTGIIPEKNRLEFEKRHDSDFAYEVEGLARFRANIFLDRKGMGAVFRVIPAKILTSEELGLSPHILQLCRLMKGLVLVTGPTGSGKSTTLCAMVDYINRTRTDHIITIEDPIEFVHENKQCVLNQREVHTHTTSFKDALRAALREDPDIILVGEMRDLETIAIAIETAETGHLVFGTLHTTTAASTVDRIIDQFPADRQAQIRVMLSESLRGVIAQTLCRKIGGGRKAALEVLIVNPAIANLIREGKTFQIPSMMQVGRSIGMVTLNEALMELVSSKAVSPEEAYLKSVEKSGMEALFKRANLDTKFIQGPPRA
jgi:twitching motility protein PilT